METTAHGVWRSPLENDGYAIMRSPYSEKATRDTIARLTDTLTQVTGGSASIRSRQGRIYAARNFLELFPLAREIWRLPALIDLLRDVLGERAGLVRGLFFDKPPDQSWSLPWHRDLTIAVENNRLPMHRFRNPTNKGGVPHVEAPRSVLESMLTLRIHLDAADEGNGALRVLPGSHRDGFDEERHGQQARTILAAAGDVLLMRPLLLHCSGTSSPGTERHRRVIHLEFAASPELPEGFAWQTFEPVAKSGFSASSCRSTRRSTGC